MSFLIVVISFWIFHGRVLFLYCIIDLDNVGINFIFCFWVCVLKCCAVDRITFQSTIKRYTLFIRIAHQMIC